MSQFYTDVNPLSRLRSSPEEGKVLRNGGSFGLNHTLLVVLASMLMLNVYYINSNA